MVFENKDNLFDQIAKHYFEHNFGTASKSEIELLMFRFYLEELIKQNSKDGIVNYNAVSDYKIAKELGITPQRVRNLKLKKELVYPQVDFNWKVSLKDLLKDENRIRIVDKNIKINIPDPSLFMEIKNYIEEQGGYVDISLNGSILTVPVKDFLQLIELVCEQEELSAIENNILEVYEKLSGEKPLLKDNWDKAKILAEVISNAACAISDIASIFTPAGIATNGIKKILEVFRR